MTTIRNGWRRTAAGAVLLLAVVGCGSESSPSRPDTLTPQAALAAAVSQTQEVQSYRFELTSSTTGAGQAVELSGKGIATSDGRSALMTFSLPGGMGEMRQRIVDGVLYLEIPQQPGVFYELPLSELVDTSLAGSTDLTAGLETLRDASADTEQVGREDVAGVTTTHYRGTVDLVRSLEILQGPLREMVEQVLATGEAEPVPFDVWIDDEGRVRRMENTVSLELPQLQGQTLVVTTRLDIGDFGVEVDVEAPPASAVRDGAPILDALGGALGSQRDPTSGPLSRTWLLRR